MIFSRSTKFSTSLDYDAVKKKLSGQAFNVHDLLFEIQDNETMFRIIPRSEFEEKYRILPITHIELKPEGSSTMISMKSKPRRIDIGGPNFLIIFCIFILISGAYLYLFKKDQMLLPSVIMMGLSVLIFIILWINLERGYFDYFRKQKAYIKSLLV